MRQFIIVGAGMGTKDGLTAQAVHALQHAACVFAAPRLAKSLSDICEVTPISINQMVAQAIACNHSPVALIVSGDTGFFSLTKHIYDKLSAHGTVEVIPGISSMQYLCAKCGQSYEDAHMLSLHGRTGYILGAVSYHRKVFVLTDGTHTAQKICQDLTQAGLGDVFVYQGENMGSDQEQICSGTAQTLSTRPCAELSCLLICNPDAANISRALRDTDFIRGKVPMTKEEIRWTAVNLLQIQPTDIIYDIGAGTGSVSVEMARHATDGLVYAIERNADGLSLIEQNRKKWGSANVISVTGCASQAMQELPMPDAAFIGGSGGELYEILLQLKSKNPHIRVCISAIALETVSLAWDSMKKLEFEHVEVRQIGAAHGKSVGNYTMMTANNPVFLISGGQFL